MKERSKKVQNFSFLFSKGLCFTWTGWDTKKNKRITWCEKCWWQHYDVGLLVLITNWAAAQSSWEDHDSKYRTFLKKPFNQLQKTWSWCWYSPFSKTSPHVHSAERTFMCSNGLVKVQTRTLLWQVENKEQHFLFLICKSSR